MPLSFLVTNTNSWDPHPVNITSVQAVGENYLTLAESARGPQIAEHLNTIAVQFYVERGKKETV